MVRQTYPYDVFVSYSHKNEKWVTEKLLPRLRESGIVFAWDRQDFVPGKPFNAEMLRLMRESKHTLIVLSAEWAGSNFTDFEYQLSRAMDPKTREGRVLVLNVDNCGTPPHLANLTAISVVVLGEEGALRKLVDYLLESKEGKRQLASIWGDFALWKELGSNPGGGYQYAGKVTVGNPMGPPIQFDSVLIRTYVPPCAEPRPHAATAVKVTFTDRGMCLGFSYDAAPEFQVPDDITPETVTLESGRGISLPDFDFGPLRGSVAGSEPVTCSISLFRGNRQLTGENWCVLPPVARLSPTSFRGPDRFEAGPGFELQLLPEKLMSPKTGILDQDVLDAMFESAGRFAQDSLLLRVQPQTMTVHSMQGGEELHTAAGWKFVFCSESKGGTFEVAPDDPTWIDPASFRPSSEKRTCWLSENLLSRCWLDASFAYLLSLTVCQSSKSVGGIVLEAVILDGIWRPVWQVPRDYEGKPAGVLADTGEVVVFDRGAIRKPRGPIWNV